MTPDEVVLGMTWMKKRPPVSHGMQFDPGMFVLSKTCKLLDGVAT